MPEANGLSERNLKYMLAFYRLYSCRQQLVADNLQGYVVACDMALNTPLENPAIGLLVCRGKNAPLAKYLLGKIDMPIGVSDYELLRKVPDDFKSQLPTVEEIEAELAANMEKEAD